MRRLSPLLFLTSVIVLLTISCANENPISAPSLTPQSQIGDSMHHPLGLFDVHIDLDSSGIEITPARVTSGHFNITSFLFPPYCADCFSISNVKIDWINRLLSCDVRVKNFTKALTGYDVRGIVYPVGDFILKNPDAYTLLYAPPGSISPAGFRAYKKTDPNRAFAPGESASENYIIEFPNGAQFINILYAIDACWPAHCPEPYDIHSFGQSALYSYAGASAQVTVYVDDWQNDAGSVSIDTSILGGTEIQLIHQWGNIWTGTITNISGVPQGTYDTLITATDQPSMNKLFQRVQIKVAQFGTDTEPPTWDDEVGIILTKPGLQGILVEFGHASDPSEPVTYNLYWVEGNILDLDTANKVTGITGSPYLLDGLSSGLHTLLLRAEDAYANETQNQIFSSAIVGEHPEIWWTQGPDMKQARGYAGAFVADGYFWVLGGGQTTEVYDSVERYNIAGGAWDSPWNLPEPRMSFACGTYNGKAYIFGGLFAPAETTSSCLIIDLSTGFVEPKSPVLPMPLAGSGCAFLKGIFYIAGGINYATDPFTVYRQVYGFNPIDKKWLDATDMEFETYSMGMAAGDTYLMTCGGDPGRIDVMYHTPGTKSWNWRAPLSFGRQGNGAIWVDGWLYSIGGESAWMSLNQVDVMNVQADQWYSISPLVNNRTCPAVATDGTYIYVAGGLKFVGPAVIGLSSFEIGKIF